MRWNFLSFTQKNNYNGELVLLLFFLRSLHIWLLPCSRRRQPLIRLKYHVFLSTLLSFCSFSAFPFHHLLLSNFFSRDAAQLIDVHLMEFRQQILHPLVSNRTHRPDVDPRGDQHIVEDDPVQLCLFLKQLEKPNTMSSGGLFKKTCWCILVCELTDDAGWMWTIDPWPSIVQNTFPTDLKWTVKPLFNTVNAGTAAAFLTDTFWQHWWNIPCTGIVWGAHFDFH